MKLRCRHGRRDCRASKGDVLGCPGAAVTQIWVTPAADGTLLGRDETRADAERPRRPAPRRGSSCSPSAPSGGAVSSRARHPRRREYGGLLRSGRAPGDPSATDPPPSSAGRLFPARSTRSRACCGPRRITGPGRPPPGPRHASGGAGCPLVGRARAALPQGSRERRGSRSRDRLRRLRRPWSGRGSCGTLRGPVGEGGAP